MINKLLKLIDFPNQNYIIEATCIFINTNMSIYDWLCENQSYLSAIF